MKTTKSKEAVALLQTEFGTVSFHESVFTSLAKQAMHETPGVADIQLRQFFGLLKGQRIEISKGTASDSVTLQVAVWLKGPINVIEVGTQLQKRLKYDVEKCLGVSVNEILIHVENIIFE